MKKIIVASIIIWTLIVLGLNGLIAYAIANILIPASELPEWFKLFYFLNL